MWPRLGPPHCTSDCVAGSHWHRTWSTGPRDPILATGLPLHGETQAGLAVEQGVWGQVGAEHRREMIEPPRYSDFEWGQAYWRGVDEGGLGELVVAGPGPACLTPAPGTQDPSPDNTEAHALFWLAAMGPRLSSDLCPHLSPALCPLTAQLAMSTKVL